MLNLPNVSVIKRDFPPSVSVVVLNFNGKAYLKTCLTSLSKLNYPKDLYEVLLVDNGSKDDSVEFVKRNFPWVKILPLGNNLGFTGGNNRGFDVSSGEFVVFLNNDTRVDANWLNELVRVAVEFDDAGICGSKILFMDNPYEVQCNGGFLNIVGGGFFKYSEKLLAPSYTGCVHGASFLVKRKIFDFIGKFDEEFFMYGDEADICLRTWLCGFSVMHVPSSIVYHSYMGSSRDVSKKIDRKSLLHGRILLLNKLRIYHGNKNAIATIVKTFDDFCFVEGILLSVIYGCIQTFLILLDKEHGDRKLCALTCLLSSFFWVVKNFRKLWKKRLILKCKKKRKVKNLVEKNLLLSFRHTLLFLRRMSCQ